MIDELHSDGVGQRQASTACELESLLHTVLEQIIPFIRSANDEHALHKLRNPISSSSLVNDLSPGALDRLLASNGTLNLPPSGLGPAGFESTLGSILKYSVNTSAPGFMDKLYSAPLPIGIAADLILSVLNTNLHVYQVSPVLTLIEKYVTKKLANMFGLVGSRAGGINIQGGSASNMTSIVIARNTLFPRTKVHGNNVDGLDLVMFTSAHGHYSIEKAAQACGFGSAAVMPVPVDLKTGRMLPNELERLIVDAKAVGKTPFYVSATAGTTVLGSFDPFVEVSEVAQRHGLWMHIDGAWGGSFVFSEKLKIEKLGESELADTIAINPHKMMGVPVTCSFLLGKDMKQFQEANTLRAGYLFHDTENGEDNVLSGLDLSSNPHTNGTGEHIEENVWREPNDLADLTLQCGRRGDSLKLFLAWQYYGTDGYRSKIENAYDVAGQMARMISGHKDLILVSQNPPPCLQVCFYYAPGGQMVFGEEDEQPRLLTIEGKAKGETINVLGKQNSNVTEWITKHLVSRGFMIDYAPALEAQEWRGKFFRAVVNISTSLETVERLVSDIEDLGTQALTALCMGHESNDR